MANSGSSCGGGEVQALEVGCSGPVQRFSGPPGVEADQVGRGGGDGVFEAGLDQPGVAGGADPGDVAGLADGALDPGADLVAVMPVLGGLFGSGRGY